MRRSAERQRPLAAALAEHQQHVQVAVHIRELETGELTAAGAGVQQQRDDGCVPAGSKPLPAQTASSRRRPSSGTTGTGCSGTIGGFIRAIGLASVSSSSSSQPYRMRRTL
jgi:hypothetical protein